MIVGYWFEHFFFFNLTFLTYVVLKVTELILGLDSFLQSFWNKVVDTVGDDRAIYNVFVYNFVAISLFWTLNCTMLFLERVVKPKFLEKYRYEVLGKANPELKVELELRKVLPVVVRNQLFGIALAFVFHLLDKNQHIKVSRELPTFMTVMRDYAVCLVCLEILNYLTHRLVHYGKFYTLFHKHHHEYDTVSGFIVQYNTLFESYVQASIPATFGFSLMRSHPFFIIVWLATLVVTSYIQHAGYTFLHHPLVLHEAHHSLNNVNYSYFGIVDKVLGSYAEVDLVNLKKKQ